MPCRKITENELKDAYLDALNSMLESEIDETWKIIERSLILAMILLFL